MIGIGVGLQVIFVGEIETRLLRHSTATGTATGVDLVSLKPGADVRFGERPIRYAISPDLLTGLDCRLPSEQEVRAVGTVASRAVLTGGQVLQSSSQARFVRSAEGRRMPWAHYMARPGTVETISKADPVRLMDGFLRAPASSATIMDLGGINTQILNRVLRHVELDQKVPFKSSPTRMRWIATTTAEQPTLTFTIPPEGVRSLVVRLPEIDHSAIAALCEDVALHDWLLGSVQKRLDMSGIGSAPVGEVVNHLLPSVNFLMPLWMPGARLNPPMREAWGRLDEVCGFTRQWQVSSRRIRDQLAVAAALNQDG